MEQALVILMVLGIFVGVPVVIGFAIVRTYILIDRRVRRDRRLEPLTEETVASTSEALDEEPSEAPTKIRAELPTAKAAGRTPVGKRQNRGPRGV